MADDRIGPVIGSIVQLDNHPRPTHIPHKDFVEEVRRRTAEQLGKAAAKAASSPVQAGISDQECRWLVRAILNEAADAVMGTTIARMKERLERALALVEGLTDPEYFPSEG